MNTKAQFATAFLATLFLATPPSEALPKADRKVAKQMLKDATLYMRIDAPCQKGRHPYGVYYKPVVKISPSGTDESGELFNAGWYHVGATQLNIRVNDPVRFDEMDFDDTEVEIELDGVDGGHTVIQFVDIHSLADFKAAFEQTFSNVPLQDAHPDWPQEIRSAISRRQLVDGMTKRQAFYVVGTPERFEKSEQDGKSIETWTLRENSGMKVGFFSTRVDQPNLSRKTIRFVDGLLEDSDSTGDHNDFSLED